jgi:hypothetical protein
MQLKALSRDAIPSALAKAERYRLLNEPGEAESICLDVLAIDPANQAALVTLALALTDQFSAEGSARAAARAAGVVAGLTDDYERAYYAGIISERRAKAHHLHGRAGSGPAVHEWLQEAMRAYERAEALRPAGNDDAILRWNACARLLAELPAVTPDVDDPGLLQLE